MTGTTAGRANGRRSTAGGAPRAHVVVDLGSWAHRVGSLRGRRYAELDLQRLADLLHGYGLEVAQLVVVGPFVPVALGRDADEEAAVRLATRNDRWWSAESARWGRGRHRGVPLRRVLGATNGRREVGADALVAAVSLELAATVPAAQSERAEVVVVCSHDADLHHLHRYAAPVPLLLAGSFSPAERRLLRRGAVVDDAQAGVVPHLAVREEDAASVAADALHDPIVLGVETLVLGDRGDWPEGVHRGSRAGDRVVVVAEGRRGRAVSSPLGRALHPAAARPEGARTVAVVDPYGIANAAISSIGVGELPRAEAFQELVGSLGWDFPIAVLAVVPDLDPIRTRGLPGELQRAWHERDAQLDALADEMAEDGDPLTVARRAVLQPDRVDRSRLDSPLERDITPLATKRLSTGLVAELWAACCAGDHRVLLCTEDPDVIWALDALAAAGIDRFAEVVRIGVHARRLRIVDQPDRSTARPAVGANPFLVLTDAQLAELVGAGSQPYGRRLRNRLHHAVRAGSEWRFEGFDPETGAAVMSTVVAAGSDPASAHPADAAADADRIEARFVGGGPHEDGRPVRPDRRTEGIALRFDPHRPCAMPVIAHDRREATPVEATVVHWRPGVIAVDVDGDLVPDAEASAGHDAHGYAPGARVTVLLGQDGSCHLADPGDHLEPTEPELVRLGPGSSRERAVHPIEDGAGGIGLPPPGTGEVPGDEGDVVLAVRSGERDGVPAWTVLSSPLPHLDWMA